MSALDACFRRWGLQISTSHCTWSLNHHFEQFDNFLYILCFREEPSFFNLLPFNIALNYYGAYHCACPDWHAYWYATQPFRLQRLIQERQCNCEMRCLPQCAYIFSHMIPNICWGDTLTGKCCITFYTVSIVSFEYQIFVVYLQWNPVGYSPKQTIAIDIPCRILLLHGILDARSQLRTK